MFCHPPLYFVYCSTYHSTFIPQALHKLKCLNLLSNPSHLYTNLQNLTLCTAYRKEKEGNTENLSLKRASHIYTTSITCYRKGGKKEK